METTTSIVQLGGSQPSFCFFGSFTPISWDFRNAWPESRVGSKGDSIRMMEKAESKESAPPALR